MMAFSYLFLPMAMPSISHLALFEKKKRGEVQSGPYIGILSPLSERLTSLQFDQWHSPGDNI